MGNPLSNEAELYERIKNENITVDPGIWDLIYHRIGDDVSAINLLCQYYLTNQQEIPFKEAEKIITYVMDVKQIINDITTTSKDNFPFPQFKENIPLHPIIRELFTHHVNNDLNIINLVVYDCIEPDLKTNPLSLNHIQKILNHTRMIRDFLEKLRQATFREAQK